MFLYELTSFSKPPGNVFSPGIALTIRLKMGIKKVVCVQTQTTLNRVPETVPTGLASAAQPASQGVLAGFCG